MESRVFASNMKKTVKLEGICPCCKGGGKITRFVSINQDVTTAEVKMMRKGGMTMQEIADSMMLNRSWMLELEQI
jgi:hypothetical protein